jgi:hypothetical protein
VQATGTVNWSWEGNGGFSAYGAFMADVVYKAEITITAKAEYLFDTDVSFSYGAGVVKTQPQPNNSAAVRNLTIVTYNQAGAATEITSYNLATRIGVPVVGHIPSSYVNDSEYTALITWTPLPPAGVFKAGDTYVATVYLYAGPNRYFGNKQFTYVLSSNETKNVENLPFTSNSMFRNVFISFGAPESTPPESPPPPGNDGDNTGGTGGTGGTDTGTGTSTGKGKIGVIINWY